MFHFNSFIEQHWQQPKPFLSVWLWPLSRLFSTGAAARRALYRYSLLPSRRLPVPVAVVGNIHAGGTGKTPVVLALVAALRARGVKVGVVSRGYGRESRAVHVLNADSSVADAGDEPLMLFRQTGVPLAVGSNRFEAGMALLAAHPDLTLIIADDGLQHYALQRDIEIAVFPAGDAARSLDVLPNGGLREPVRRLQTVNALVFSACDAGKALPQPTFALPQKVFCSRLETGAIYRLCRPEETLDGEKLAAGYLKGRRIAALAGIARPERFFTSLHRLGIELAQTKILPDHAALTVADLPDADMVFITEKDAVKLAGNAPENVWVLPVCAIIEPDLAAWLTAELAASQPW